MRILRYSVLLFFWLTGFSDYLQGAPRIGLVDHWQPCCSAFAELGGTAVVTKVDSAQDSLRLAADSLARLVDSLKVVLDSIRSDSIRKAPEKPPAEKEQKSAPPKPPPKIWSGNFGMGLTIIRGNSHQGALISRLNVNGKGKKLRYKSDASVVSIVRGTEGPNTNKGSLKSKLEYFHSQRFFYFVAFDADYNRKAGIDMRLAPGTGVGIAVIKNGKSSLNLNLGANPITEYLRDQTRHTKGSYLGSQDLELIISKQFKLNQSITFKPRFNRVQDYLLSFTLAFTVNLTTHFDFKFNLEDKYASRPPAHDPPYQRRDWMYYTSIAYNI